LQAVAVVRVPQTPMREMVAGGLADIVVRFQAKTLAVGKVLKMS
jgi:hypothetical protein